MKIELPSVYPYSNIYTKSYNEFEAYEGNGLSDFYDNNL